MDAAVITDLAYVFEDEINLANIFAIALERAGYQTLAMNDGKAAIEYLRENPESPRLVVLDLNLPQVSGKDILRFIRMNERFAGTRVIIATADSAATVGNLADTSDLVLYKPISPAQLSDLARRFH
jgi:DNA-binding response OmpR family regulator